MQQESYRTVISGYCWGLELQGSIAFQVFWRESTFIACMVNKIKPEEVKPPN